MHHYKVNLQWKGGREGEISSPELDTKIEVATPPEFPKGVPGIWSPEHLFTAAVNSCFMTTFLAIAENSKLNFIEFYCDSDGLLSMVDGRYLMTEVVLYPRIVLADLADMEKAQKVLAKSEKACLVTNSINSTIRVIAEITQAHSQKV